VPHFLRVCPVCWRNVAGFGVSLIGRGVSKARFWPQDSFCQLKVEAVSAFQQH
jgi:hypothetical protein